MLATGGGFSVFSLLVASGCLNSVEECLRAVGLDLESLSISLEFSFETAFLEVSVCIDGAGCFRISVRMSSGRLFQTSWS